MILDKKTIEYLSDLARIHLDEKRKEKILKDLEKILEYFENLKTVNTDGVEAMTGGTELLNVLREDRDETTKISGESAANSFPHRKDGYNKIPPVFE